MTHTYRPQGWYLLLASLYGKPASLPEGTPCRQVHQVRRLPFYRVQLLGPGQVKPGDRVQQPQGIGVAGVPIDISGRPPLNDFAGIHNVDPIGVAGHYTQIVRNDKKGDSVLPAEILHQIQYLGLNSHVQRGGRLVGYDQLGVAAQRYGYHHPLEHASAELMWKLLEPALRVRYPHLLKTTHSLPAGLRLAHGKVEFKRLGKLALDGENRVEGGHGFLIDHGNLLAADASDLRVGQLEQVSTIEDDFPAHRFARRVGNEAHDGQSAHTLAAAALSHEAQGFSLFESIGDSIDRLHHAFLGEEMGL